MPIYDYKCECGFEFEDLKSIDDRFNVICKKCGSKNCQLLITTRGRDWFRPFWHEDFCDTPIYVESKEHYKKLCKKYGVQARCLL